MKTWAPLATACELIAVFGCILLYIWRWQSSHPLLWIPILAFIILTQVLHHDSPRALGLTLSEIRGSAGIILPIAVAVYVPVVIYALASGRFAFLWPGTAAWDRLFGYGIWCCFQQYLMQCYFHRRLMSLIKTPYVSSAIVAVMFGAAHIPNAVLIAATIVGGFILAEVYRRHPNIWPLALAQAVGGLLIAALVPAAVIHNMRVGPGYYTYRPPS
jgi:membrane protease YdiL (CAAX protease family)